MRRISLSGWREKITTVGFIAINTILFIMCAFSGDLLYNEGAFSLWYLWRGREWWRLVTSMFLHADIEHLLSNMLILYLAGELVERYIGRFRFALLYFCSGICGSLLYAGYEFMTETYGETIGASGAVFGVIGALFVIVIHHRGRYADITIGRMGFMIVYMLYVGMRTSNVNNAAHIGGLIGGMLLMVIYMLTGTGKGRRKYT